jgi:hypothetical protein
MRPTRSSCPPYGNHDAGGVAVLVAKSLASDAIFFHESLVDGRVQRAQASWEQSTVVIYNLILERIASDSEKAKVDPLHWVVIAMGDMNFGAPASIVGHISRIGQGHVGHKAITPSFDAKNGRSYQATSLRLSSLLGRDMVYRPQPAHSLIGCSLRCHPGKPCRPPFGRVRFGEQPMAGSKASATTHLSESRSLRGNRFHNRTDTSRCGWPKVLPLQGAFKPSL